MSNMLEVKNKYTRTTGVSIVNFEHILQFILLLLLLNSNKYSKTLVSDNELFSIIVRNILSYCYKKAFEIHVFIFKHPT